jgi:uncharacterized protein
VRLRIVKTPYYSYSIGTLPKGCKECVKGNKLVLFVTGICSKHCFYCPISDQKWLHDDVYANEWKIEKDDDLLEEARLTNATGAGITGGDPIARLEKTIHYIKYLKRTFGKKFHIHLYTPLELLSFEKLKKLYDAGLDEIRVHPDLENKKDWKKIELMKKFRWHYGIEVPAIPGYEKMTEQLIDYAQEHIQFLNINELEISDTNASKLHERGFMPKNRLSYGVKGSEALALRLMRHAQGKISDIHYCTCTLKDKVQMANRIKKRAKNIIRPFEQMTDEGTIIRGAIYIDAIRPGFNYRKRLDAIKMNKGSHDSILKTLQKKRSLLIRKYTIPNTELVIDSYKLRLITSSRLINALKGKLKKDSLFPAIVEEYPTRDGFEIEIDML